MPGQPENPAEEVRHLRRCISDLVSVLALPATWTGGRPSQIVGNSLDALVSKQAAGNSPKWNGPYLKNQSFIPKDPWGNPYMYKVPGDQGRDYDISSAGPDGQPGTGDDIQSWNLQGHQ